MNDWESAQGKEIVSPRDMGRRRLSRVEVSQFVIDRLYAAGSAVQVKDLSAVLPRRSRKHLRRVMRKLERKGFIIPGDMATRAGFEDDLAGSYRLAPGYSPMHATRSLASLKERHDAYLRTLGITFKGHLFAFVALNIFLVSLNLTISTGFPWSFFVIGGWGLLLLQHLSQFLTAKKNAADLEPLSSLSERKYRRFRSLRRLRYLRNSLAVLIPSVSAFLFGTNLITGPSYLWAFIPFGAMVFGLGTLVYSFTEIIKSRKREISGGDALEGTGRIGERAAMPQALPDSEQGIRARDVAQSILRRLEMLGFPRETHIQEMGTALREYVTRVDELAVRMADCEALVSESRNMDINDEMSRLQAKAAAAEGELKREYQAAFKQAESRKLSLEKLERQHEILGLRMQSALNSLFQLQLDVAGMDRADSPDEAATLKELREKSAALTDYLHDLKEGFQELEGP